MRCTTPCGAAIGFLPAPVAAKLAPLIRARAVSLTAVTTRDAPKLENAPVSVTVRFHSANVDATPNAAANAANAADAAPIDLDAQDALVDTLRAIAKEHRDNLSQASRRFLDRLKHVFQTVETIERRAIGDDELALFRAFERLTPPAQLLFARLSLRNKTYFASNKIHTSDVHDVHKTVRELLAAELCAPVDVMDLKSSPASLATAVVDDVFSNKAELIDMLAAMNKPAKANAKRDELVAVVSRGVRSQQQLKWSFVVGRVGATATGTGTSASASASAPAKLMSDACGTVFKIDSRRLLAFHRTIRLFFLNEGHSLGTLYAVDAGAVRYPTFPITRAREVFPDRSAFLEYEQALLDAHALIGAIDRAGAHRQADRDASDEILTAALAPAWHFLDTQSNKVPPDPTVPPFLRQYSARWLHCVQATVGVGILERQKNYPTAIERIQQLLGGHDCSERRGHWWIRLSTALEHVGRPTDALELAETALADPAIADHERLTLRKRVLKLSKPPRRWLKPAWKDDMPSDPRIVTIHAAAQPSTGAVRQARVRYAPLYATSTTTTPTATTPTTTTTTPTSTISVEQLALDYYASDTGGNWDGIHTEGRIFTTLFTLLLWPALFELPVPDAFRTSLQTAPLDLDSPGFSECRTAKIHEILAAVRDGHAPRLLEERWTTHHGVNARGIGNWDQWNLDQLKTIVRCLGGAAIASILGILCRDYRAMTAGMPDLVLWNADRCAAKLSEVKSQRDSLRYDDRTIGRHDDPDSLVPSLFALRSSLQRQADPLDTRAGEGRHRRGSAPSETPEAWTVTDPPGRSPTDCNPHLHTSGGAIECPPPPRTIFIFISFIEYTIGGSLSTRRVQSPVVGGLSAFLSGQISRCRRRRDRPWRCPS